MTSCWEDERGSETTDIAVVGGGIAGLSLAAAVSQAGLQCEVFEQATSVPQIGAGVQISPNASRLLHRLGLADFLRSVTVRPEAIELRRWDNGHVLARTPLGDACESLYGAPYYTMHRADLLRGLLQLVPARAIHLGHSCTGIMWRACGRPEVCFAGRSVTANVVVGADGIHSTVRDSIVADHPRFSGQVIYRGLVPAWRLPALREEPRVILWIGPGQHCVCYPISGGELLNVAATTRANSWCAESWTAEGRPEDLQAAYAGWHDDVTQILSTVGAVSRWQLHDRDTVERWGRQRVTLTGDAAHPMLPFVAQGANMAIEDAVALATHLRAVGPSGLAQALRGYEQDRRPRTAEVHRLSRINLTALHLPDGDGQRRRDSLMEADHDLRSREWLYGYDAERVAQRSG